MLKDQPSLLSQETGRTPERCGRLLPRVLWILTVVVSVFPASPANGQQFGRSSESADEGRPRTLSPQLAERLQRKLKSGSFETHSSSSDRTSDSPSSADSWRSGEKDPVGLDRPVSVPRSNNPETSADLTQEFSAEAVPALRATPQNEPSGTALGIRQVSATLEDVTDEPFLSLELPATKPTGETTSGHSPEVTMETTPGNIIVRAAVWVVIAFCLLTLAILGVRRWQRSRGLLPTSNSRSRVIETLSVGPGRTVSLIEMAGLRALVASDAGGIRSLVLAPSEFQDELQRELAEPHVDLSTRAERPGS